MPSSSESPLRPLHQFELGMGDRDVLFDILKLTFSFLDRNQAAYSAPERVRLEAFLRLFVPLLFGVPHADMEANLAHSDETHENEVEEDEAESELDAASDNDASGSEAGEPVPNGHSGPSLNGKAKNGLHKVADLRKRVLAHAATTSARSKPPSRGGSPTDEGGSTPVGVLGEQTWINLTEAREGEMASDEPLEVRRFNFFANSTFYCLVRVIHVRFLALPALFESC